MAEDREALAGIEYHGVAGSTFDCKDAVLRLLQCGWVVDRVRILSYSKSHCLLLTHKQGDQIAIKSGFSSGYGGTGPTYFSFILQLLASHGAEIDEFRVEETTIEKVDKSALTIGELQTINEATPVRPSRWPEYIYESDFEAAEDGSLWAKFAPLIPYSAVDPRLIDLALKFHIDEDYSLSRGYRRLEDIVRLRTGVTEYGSKLFSQAFQGETPLLTWNKVEKSEIIGRANLFTGAYMAFRNPRAHQEIRDNNLLSEFLLLNILYQLEGAAVETNKSP